MATDPRVHRIRIAEMNIPQWARTLRLDSPNLPTGDALDGARRWVDEFRDHYVTSVRPFEEYPEDTSQIGRGLLFIGVAGTGKTSLACATAIETYYRWPRIMPYFITMPELIEARLHDDIDAWDKTMYSQVLVLDDVGKEHSSKSGWSGSILDHVLRSRHNNATPTFITSNVALPEWEGYNDSMRSFLAGSTDLYTFKGRDKRR